MYAINSHRSKNCESLFLILFLTLLFIISVNKKYFQFCIILLKRILTIIYSNIISYQFHLKKEQIYYISYTHINEG